MVGVLVGVVVVGDVVGEVVPVVVVVGVVDWLVVAVVDCELVGVVVGDDDALVVWLEVTVLVCDDV